MLQFADPSTREGAALKFALQTHNGTSAATAKRVLDAAVARFGADAQRFALQVLVQDAIHTRYWAEVPADNSRLVLLKEQLAAASASAGRIGLFTEAFELVEVSEALVNDFLSKEILRISPADQLAIIVALNHATNEGTRTIGKKILQRRIADVTSEAAAEKFANTIADDQVVRQLAAMTLVDPQYQQFNRAMAAYTVATGPVLDAPKEFSARTDCHVTLAAFMEDLGPICIATAEDAKETLQLYPWPVNAREVAGALALFMSTVPDRHDTGSWSSVRTALKEGGAGGAKRGPASPTTVAWAHVNFAEAVTAVNPSLDWMTVLSELDCPTCKLDNGMRVGAVLACYRKATSTPPPIVPFLKPWLHAPGSQVQILKFYASNPDVFDRTGLLTLPANLAPSGVSSADYSVAWHSPAFVGALLDCAAVGGRAVDNIVSQMLLSAAKAAPAAVAAAMLTANATRATRVQKHLTDIFLAVGVGVCLTPEAVDFVFKQNRGPLMLRLLAQYVAADHGRAASVLPILQAARLFPKILAVATDPVVHVLLAISGQECGHVPTHYLSDALSSTAPHTKDLPVSRVPLAMATVDVCDDLLSKGSAVSVAIRTALAAVCNSGLAPIIPSVLAHARSLNSAATAFGSDHPDDAPDNEEFSEEMLDAGAKIVEDACKTTDPTSQVDLQRVMALKASSDPKDHTILRCVCRTVIDEAACVNQYPPSAFYNFARYFGLLVMNDLFSPRDLRLALRVILGSVVSPSDPRIRDFGCHALSQFKERLGEWPSFRHSLRQAQDLDMYLPGIIAHLNAADKRDADRSASPEPGSESSKAASPTGAAEGKDGLSGLHQHDIRIIAGNSGGQAPSSVVQDRINFLVGNTDTDAEKTEAHARELKTLLRPEYHQHFAEYLVVKRVALEPNNHRTYLSLVERLDSPDLETKIRKATIIACKRLFQSDKVCTNSSERSLLKSLGSWLGQITFAKNIPVLARDLDLRELIPNALREGKLIAVVPFLAKLIEHSASSRAFRLPNPLIMGLLAQLAEMYHLDDLKITLRFEVEVLCRNLHIAITDLHDFAQKERPQREPLHELKVRFVDVHNSFDFRPTTEDSEPPRTKQLNVNVAPFKPGVGGEGPPGVGGQGLMRQSSGLPPQSFLVLRQLNPGRELANIPPQHHLQYRQMLQHAFDAGLQDTMAALDRSATVACSTTRELVSKDFARDRNDQHLAHAAHAMARGLATSLAGITARDLAVSHCRKYLGQQLPRVFTPETVGDVIDNLLLDNLNGIQAALEETTIELVAVKVDHDLSRLYDDRHQAWRTNERAFPREPVSAQTMAALERLPEALRPQHGLQPHHLAVYTAFLPARADSTVEQVVQLLQVIEDAALRHYTECPAASNPAHVLSLTNVSFTETTQSEHHDVIKNKLVEVNQWINEANAVPLLANLFPRIMVLAEKVQAEQRNPTQLHHVQLLLNEVCLFVLQAIRERGQGKAVSELTRLYAAHEKRWVNKELAANLIRLRVIDIAEFDRVLHKALQEPARQAAVEFAGYIVQKCLIEDKLATVRDLKLTLEILETIAEQSKRQRAPTRMRVPTMHNQPYRQEIEAYFTEWMQICDKRPSTQQQQPAGQPQSGSPAPAGAAAGAGGDATGQPPQQSKQVIALNFVKKLQDSGMLKADKMLDRFFGVLCELAVEDYATHVMLSERALTPEQRAAQAAAAPEISRGQVHPPPARLASEPKVFHAVDAFSDLVVVLIKCCAWSSKRDDTSRQQGAAESALVTRVLHVVGKALQFNHDFSVDRNAVEPEYRQQPQLPEGSQLQDQHLQQPYMRFLSNLMIALAQNAPDDQPSEFFNIMANTLHSLNPQRLPGFAFAWIELVGHRLFISKLMRQPECWPLYFKLINDALRFVEPFARPSEMTPPLVLYFKCVLKLMLLLLHDFSEFLLTFHQPLCDVIPPCCIQLRNIVLSAFPRQTKLPDPFTRNGRYNQLPELRESPTLIPSVKNPFENKFNGVLCPVSKADFDSYINKKEPADFPKKLVQILTPAAGQPMNVPLLSGMILYGAIATLAKQGPLIKDAFANAAAANTTVDPDPLTFNETMPIAEILRQLLASFGSEGRYHVVNACVNQLRFPNAHTHFFSLALQHLFAHACPHQEHVQEHITRVLVERLIISRPHPWGLLITFFDIVKDARNGFWEKPFIRCTPEIERMFESVAQSVSPSQQQPQPQPQQASQPQPTTTAGGGSVAPGQPSQAPSQGAPSQPQPQPQPQPLPTPVPNNAGLQQPGAQRR